MPEKRPQAVFLMDQWQEKASGIEAVASPG